MNATEREDVLVKVEGVSKKYCLNLRQSLWYGVQDVARELNPFRRSGNAGSRLLPADVDREIAGRDGNDMEPNRGLRPGEFWAVRNVSFELRRRECLGLVGRNGAGKSTLLKLLNGLIKPDEGRITLRGKVAALIALGAGFNPILTGRENIQVNASILGYSRAAIQGKLDEIIEFSELRDFIDTPVQSYSSGMQVRLGFSVAVHLEPDILLVDEVLAVGDAGFKQKAYNAIYRIMQNAAVILVSHSVTQIAKVCNSGMLLHQGCVKVRSDRIEDVIDAYFREFPAGQMRTGGKGKARLYEVRLLTEAGAPIGRAEFSGATRAASDPFPLIRHGQSLVVEVVLSLDPSIEHYELSFGFSDMESRLVAQCASFNRRSSFRNSGARHVIRFTLGSVLFNKGKYTLDIALYAQSALGTVRGEIVAQWDTVIEFQVSADAVLLGGAPVQLAGEWTTGGEGENVR